MEDSQSENVGYWIASIGIVIPGIIVAGIWPAWNVLPLWAWALIAGSSGGLGMAIAYTPRTASFAGGTVAGICIPIALAVYVNLRSNLPYAIWSLEFILPGFLGALPGVGVYKLICAAVGYFDADIVSESNGLQLDS